MDIIFKHTAYFHKEELDNYLKFSAGLEGSTKDFNKEEMNILIEATYYLATQVGLEIDDNEIIKTK